MPFMIPRTQKGLEINRSPKSEDKKRDIFSIEDGSKREKKGFNPKYEHQMADFTVSAAMMDPSLI